MLGARRTEATLLGRLCLSPARLSEGSGEIDARGPRYELGGPASGAPGRPRVCSAGRALVLELDRTEEVVAEVVRVLESVLDIAADDAARRIVAGGFLLSSDIFRARSSELRFNRGGAAGARVLATWIDSARL